ncbi:hypothetical protein [Nitrosophilus alvini]|uniref:hypothetical protein n=1 Tax=Nitrosophilus alvini TaxID=2714855 RepID=UPI00190A4D4A|nr:hypothetical protein [Nitrosophilus alvini]
METIFNEYARYILFLHILGAVVWVGGMIAVRFAVHPALQNIQDSRIRLARTLEIVYRLFMLVMPFLVIIVFTGVVMSIGMGFKNTDFGYLTHVKEGIWTVMALNYGSMFYIRKRAEQFFIAGNHEKTKSLMQILSKYMLPVNIILGLIAIFLGTVLRGF